MKSTIVSKLEKVSYPCLMQYTDDDTEMVVLMVNPGSGTVVYLNKDMEKAVTRYCLGYYSTDWTLNIDYDKGKWSVFKGSIVLEN